jgi:hypothetical protein
MFAKGAHVETRDFFLTLPIEVRERLADEAHRASAALMVAEHFCQYQVGWSHMDGAFAATCISFPLATYLDTTSPECSLTGIVALATRYIAVRAALRSPLFDAQG